MLGSAFTRRSLLALPLVAWAPQLLAKAAAASAPIKLLRINSAQFRVSDVQRSVDFYQRLFGLPVVARHGDSAVLRLGAGPQHLMISPAKGQPTGIASFGLAAVDFDAARLVQRLHAQGVPSARIVPQTPDIGGAPQVYLKDSRGFELLLQAPTDAGGKGPRGDTLLDAPAPMGRPPIPIAGFSHVTLFAEGAFYRRIFGLPVQTTQGPVNVLRIGDGIEFITGIDMNIPIPNPPMPGHICLTMQGFDANIVTGILAQQGLKPVEYQAQDDAKPLTVRTRLRQVDGNGGGPTHPLGSYETYLRDPDNIEIQIQDVAYCGGSGANGQICP